jgi:subtilase family serine protease
MRHRPLLGVATAAAALTATVLATAGTAAAGSNPTGAAVSTVTSTRVCAVAPVGFAACNARVRTTTSLRPNATTTPSGGYTPAQLKSAYGLTGRNGTLTIAIVDAFAHPNAAADLAVYRNQFGLGAANLRQVNQTGGTALPAADVGWGQEEMLDLEMASAICPGCPILYVGGNSASFNDLATAVDTAARLGARVISNSYGGAEFSTETSLAAHYSHSGVAITASSGDSGFGPQVPAAFKTLTAVGGTHLTLTASGTRSTETVWSGAGSGCSRFITKPTWQHDTGCARRTISDVSAVADPATGVDVYDSFGSTGGRNWFVFGGTSVAAPIIGGVYALSGNTAGTPASLAYTAPAGSLFDVKSGSNGTCSPAYLCTGVTGYDGPSGLGTPNGTAAF